MIEITRRDFIKSAIISGTLSLISFRLIDTLFKGRKPIPVRARYWKRV